MNLLDDIRNTIQTYINALNSGVSPANPIQLVSAPNLPFHQITLTKGAGAKAWEFDATQQSGSNHTALIRGHTDATAKKICLNHAEFCDCEFPMEISMILEDTEDAHIVFEKCLFQNKFKIRNMEVGTYEKQQENKAKLSKLEFLDCEMRSDNSTPYLRIGFLAVENFRLSNLRIPRDAEVNIGDCQFTNFTLANIRNLGKLKLYKINSLKSERDAGKGGTFRIDNTSIGDAEFQSVNLASFSTRMMYDNILSGLKYTNLWWEKKSGSGIKVGEFDRSDTKFAKKRDTYRALKNVAINSDDSPKASAFYAKEMEYHLKLIRDKNSKGRPDSSWQEKTILGFSNLTSNFGQSWLRPIGWILFSGWVFYTALLFSFDGPYDPKLWGEYWVFLNPTHKTEFVAEGCWNGCSYFIDALFRVFEGSFIYQAIQAFRRHSRKF